MSFRKNQTSLLPAWCVTASCRHQEFYLFTRQSVIILYAEHRLFLAKPSLKFNFYVNSQIKATDQGSPSRSSTARLDIEWIARPPPSAEPITFDEPHFTFAVMETEPVTHMVGIIMTETLGLRWFDITGEGKRAHAELSRL